MRDATVKESLSSPFALPRAGAAAVAAAARAAAAVGAAARAAGAPFADHRRLSDGDGHVNRSCGFPSLFCRPDL